MASLFLAFLCTTCYIKYRSSDSSTSSSVHTLQLADSKHGSKGLKT